MKLLETPYGYYDITTRAHYEINSYMDRTTDLTEFRVWFVRAEHPECDHEGDRTHTRLTDNVTSRAAAEAELDRIAALISGEAAPVPSFGWVPGPPPDDGKWYLVRYDDEPTPGVARFSSGQAEYVDDAGQSYGGNLITHHNPTPISLEIP
jgi:hypothetical protein